MVYSFSTLKQTKYLTNQKKPQTNKKIEQNNLLFGRKTKIEIRYIPTTAEDSENKVYTESGAIALSYPPRVRVRATVQLSTVLFHDESSK